eukprot:6490702-Amphidinium_carterae.2
MGPEEFLKAYSPMVDVVLAPDRVARVLAVTEASGWDGVRNDIAVLTSTSALGAKLFACAARAVVAVLARKEIEDELDKLKSLEAITDKQVAEATTKAMQKVRDLQGVAELRKKREIVVEYRDWTMTRRVDCIEEEVEERLQARLRGWAAECKSIKELPGESALCSPDPSLKVKRIDVPSVRKAGACRAFMLSLLKGIPKEKLHGEAVLVYETQNATTSPLEHHQPRGNTLA